MLRKVLKKTIAASIVLVMSAVSLVLNPVHAVSQEVPSITLSKTNTTLDDTLEVIINNGNSRDDAWVGLYEINETPDGNPTSIWWKYLTEVGVHNGNGTFKLDLSSINSDRFVPSNRYKLVLFKDDLGGYPIDASANLNLIDEIRQGDGDLEFLAISDVHISDTAAEKKFEKALTKAQEMLSNVDGIVIAGDFTNNGKTDEYDNFMKVYNTYVNTNPLKLWVMGNHDYWNGLSAVDAQDRFENKTGEKITSHKILEGYHFIQVSTEGRETPGVFTDSLKAWLKEQLEVAKNDDPEKPIFVTVHQHIKDTVYGSHEWGNSALYDVLDDYPQVITFSGHSHYALSDERSIHQKDFTSVGTASLKYMELEAGKIQGSIPPGGSNVSTGLLVSVEKNTNKVTMKRMDFYNDRVIKDNWVIESPSDKTKYKYTDARIDDSENPYFEDVAKLEVEYIQSGTVRITFDQAKDEDMVHSYKIQAVNKETGEVNVEVLAFSEFYIYPMPDKLSFDISGLSADTNYDLVVMAIDTFGKESLVPLRGSAVKPTLTLSKNKVNLNETIEVTLKNGRTTPGNADWIGLYEENETPDGDPYSIWWRTLPDLGITGESGTFTFNPSDITSDNKDRYFGGGKYKFIFAYDDTYHIETSESFTIIDSVQENIALNKSCSASSEENVFHKNDASKGNDGNMSTRWCANNGDNNHWWKVDLSTNYDITGSEVVWEYDEKIYHYKIEVSSDDINWTTIVDKTNNTSTSQVQMAEFTANARYVRITITGLESGCWASIKEFKVFI